ncbi:hypothetical protein ACFOVU_07140 [Nocardiopsis sediminis]|uniref:Uncharacterized protein n=1 Tax=Nocardiopsis sediminis TaxID=1778267 RepID=A0ABV8FL20_9ACTN
MLIAAATPALEDTVTLSDGSWPAFAIIALWMGGFTGGMLGGIVLAVRWHAERGVRGPRERFFSADPMHTLSLD